MVGSLAASVGVGVVALLRYVFDARRPASRGCGRCEK